MRRLFCVLMICSLLLVALPVTASPGPDTSATPPAIPTTGDVWDGSIEQPTKIVKKDNVNYYEITKCSQLAFVAQNGGEWLGRNYLLANNLILNDVVLEWDEDGSLLNNPSTLHQWTPIGDYDHVFTGRFESDGHTVSGLFVNQTASYAGLFGYSQRSIESINVVNAYVKGDSFVGGVVAVVVNDAADLVFQGLVIGGGNHVGGVVGGASNLRNCINYGMVLGSDSHVGGVAGSSSLVNDCINYGKVTGGGAYVGGIVGKSGIKGYGSITDQITNCANFGEVTGGSSVGGVAGDNLWDTTNCINYGVVLGTGDDVGGLVGNNHRKVGNSINYSAITGKGNRVGGVAGFGASADNCTNYGVVIGNGDRVGGIIGQGWGTKCINYNKITGGSSVGGVVGSGEASQCVNNGVVTGNGEQIGGVVGYCDFASNCYNTETVIGQNNVGGIAGILYYNRSITNCYNIGSVVCIASGSAVGAITSSDGAIWGDDTISGCYYLKTETINRDLFGCGGITSEIGEQKGFYSRNESEMKTQNSYDGWDFSKTWAITSGLNNGYPYFLWQDVSGIPFMGLVLLQPTLTLGVGDMSNLTVRPVPAVADLPTPEWESDDETVATVNNNGRVTAVGAGTATVTVSIGSFTAICTVTVSARTPNEYRIGALTVRNADGAALTSIPAGQFTVEIPVTKLTAGGNTLVFLAAYGADGQYIGLLYDTVEDVFVGETVDVTLPMDNTKGEITQLKAFSIASFSYLVPIGTASCFPAQ